MASSSPSPKPYDYSNNPVLANTTFVHADPTSFRSIVQRLTGTSQPDPPRTQPASKLHERRMMSHIARKLEVQLGDGPGGSGRVMGSPVSPLDLFPSPRTPVVVMQKEEERAIAEKGFYLHPSPRVLGRGPEPELLPLFPLHSPRVDPSNTSSS